jgi:uncharacterized protein YutD
MKDRDSSPLLRMTTFFDRDSSPLLRMTTFFDRDSSPLLRMTTFFDRDSSPAAQNDINMINFYLLFYNNYSTTDTFVKNLNPKGEV